MMLILLAAMALPANRSLSSLPSAADQRDSPDVEYRYTVRDGDLHYDVRGWKVDKEVFYDPREPFNVRSKHEAAYPAIGPRVANQGLFLNKSHATGFEATTMRGHVFAQAAVDRNEFKPTRLALTVYGGTSAERAQVLDDCNHCLALSVHKQALAIQSYEAGHWSIDPKLGFPTAGSPTIMLELPDGRELWRADSIKDYIHGPKGLAHAIVEGRRILDPTYRPNVTPGPRGPRDGGICPFGFNRRHWPLVIVTVIACAWLILDPRK